jgi:erythromycin esterase
LPQSRIDFLLWHGRSYAMTSNCMEVAISQFQNREQAGEFLVEKLRKFQSDDPVFFALPRGGVSVALPIAQAFNRKLNLLLAKKISVPGFPEVALGAIVEDEEPIWQETAFSYLKLETAELDRAVTRTRQEIGRQRNLWKVDSRVFNLQDRTVLLVDDGLATGATLFAAVEFLQKRNPAKLIVAIPVGAKSSIEFLKPLVTELIYLLAPENFQAVSDYYANFAQVSDREVSEMLEKQTHVKKSVRRKATLQNDQNSIVQEILQTAVPLNQESKLNGLLKRMSQSRVVMLGEATHGTFEFYQLRRLISQKLIQDYGFQFIAVEGDWPDCWKLNQYIAAGEGSSARQIMQTFNRWPTWMWANEETEKLIEWMRKNGGNFYGLDVYSLFDSIDTIKEYAQKIKGPLSDEILKAYRCFDPYDRDEKAYARSLLKLPMGCQDEVIGSLRKLLRLRLEQTSSEAPELFNAKQNAKIIQNAERYYRSMVEGNEDSWNVRDEHMMETLDSLLLRHGEGAKCIVWAHNTHIGDYHATDMLEAGNINLGGLARERYGLDDVCLVGFGTYGGEVLAGKAWGSPAEIMKLPEARPGSYENDFHQVAQKLSEDRFFVSFDHSHESSLEQKQGHRAVGVVYQSSFERAGHNYVPTSLANRYDAFVFVDQTSALKAIATQESHKDLPETWPSGT